MSFFDWLRRLFGLQVRRDVTMIAGEQAGIDAVSEVVDLAGGPLKEGHRRLALRDRRLLPKGPRLPLVKRKKVFSRQEAERLFSRSMRTQNRAIRDLLPDEAQLGRYGLPLWRSEDELAGALGLTRGELSFFAAHRENDGAEHYLRFAIPKRTGGERVIMAPKRRLKVIQRKLHQLLIAKLPLSDAAHGFRAGRSIKTGALPHARKQVLLHLDLEDFFGSVTFRRVRGFWIALGYGYPVATALALLMTEAERQPVELEGRLAFVPIGERYAVQGAPTSPGLCNAIALRLDRRLAGLARARGFVYTRYADDLTFSGDDLEAVEGLRRTAKAIIAREGFRVNDKKTRVMKRSAAQRVTGVTVNDGAGLSRRERRKIRALIHQHGQNPARAAEIRGKLAYLAMLSPEQAARLSARLVGE